MQISSLSNRIHTGIYDNGQDLFKMNYGNFEINRNSIYILIVGNVSKAIKILSVKLQMNEEFLIGICQNDFDLTGKVNGKETFVQSN